MSTATAHPSPATCTDTSNPNIGQFVPSISASSGIDLQTLPGQCVLPEPEQGSAPSPLEESKDLTLYIHPEEESSPNFHHFNTSTDIPASPVSNNAEEQSTNETDLTRDAEESRPEDPLLDQNAERELSNDTTSTVQSKNKCWIVLTVTLVYLVVLIIVCVMGSLLFVNFYPINEEKVAVGGNTSVSLINKGFSSLLTKAVEVTLDEGINPTSFFMAACSQVKERYITLPQRPPIFLEEDELDTIAPLNYFDTDLPIYSAGPLHISYMTVANSSIPYYSPTDSCPLQIFLFDRNITYQQSQDSSEITGYVQKSPCLLNASQGEYYINQTSRTMFAVELSHPRFYFVLASIKKGVSMSTKIIVNLTMYETDDLSPMPCLGETFPVKCNFPTSNSTFPSRKMCFFAKSVDAVTPPYFNVTISSTVNMLAWVLCILLPIVLPLVVLYFIAVAVIYYRMRRRNLSSVE